MKQYTVILPDVIQARSEQAAWDAFLEYMGECHLMGDVSCFDFVEVIPPDDVPSPTTRLPHIIVDGYWVDDRTEFEGYVISQYNDIEEDDDSIFFYGLSESEIAESLGKETGEDFVITRYEVAN